MAGTAAASVLGVERSIAGKRWRARLADERVGLALAQRLGVPEIVGRVLAGRGVDVAAAESFLNPTVRELLPDPSHLKGMDDAAERVAGAVIAGERIAVFGDYDVDGATAAALLVRFLAAVGAGTRVYIPDRRTEGYGPNAPALLRLRGEGASVVITVDCGTAAHDALAEAAQAGLDVIVVDHHAAEAVLPPAIAVVNPNRLDETTSHRQLAAVGVAFLLVVAVNRVLRGVGWYAARPEPDILQWLDLVALGTVCDVVPLTGLNRALVAQGLKVMARRGNAGLRALADTARLTEAPGTYHVGFLLGPRINAGGRVGASDLGQRLLSTDDAAEAAEIARRLDTLNRERQEIEAAVLAQALDVAGAGALALAVGEGWHPGVIGIVAGRLRERFDRPACVVAFDGETGTGSARSIGGVDIGAAVIAARQAGLVVKGGGHAMAAGFTVARGRIDDLVRFLEERVADAMRRADVVPSLSLDGALAVGGATLDLVAAVARVAPFGVGNPEPRFVVPGARLLYTDAVGDGSHLRCVLGDGGGRLDAIAFRAMDGSLGPALIAHAGRPFHIAGKLRENTWQGRSSPQLLIDDAAPAW